MLSPVRGRFFEKDVSRDKKSGKYKDDDFKKLKSIMALLVTEERLDATLKDHPLKGEWDGCRECHVKPDWLLVYRIDKERDEIIFTRLGTHSELFG